MDIKNKIREFIFKRYNVSFSQGGGDDIQLKKLIKNDKPGTYVDIGCWHPVKISNTYHFYLRGWRGICIDPNSDLEKLYEKYRPTDTFINCAVGLDEKELKYYQLNDRYSPMNTLNYDFIEKNNMQSEVKNVINIPTKSLKEILDIHLSKNERLDFFDIDAEGFDLEVLKSNDWSKYRPKIVLIETDKPLKLDVNSEIENYLNSVNYKIVAKSVINGDLGNLFFVDTTVL